MGWGDELMASGQAKRAQLTDSRKVQIIGADGAARWNEIWQNNPRIAHPSEIGNFQRIVNGGNARPYILAKTHEKWIWRNFDCTPGEIYFNANEKNFAKQFKPQVIIEPTLKPKASMNKQWGYWQEFARLADRQGIMLTQLAPSGISDLKNVNVIHTYDFRHACAVLANATAYVGHEGGLHHAAAALNVPGVVIYGGFISPKQTGYDLHKNLFTGNEPCGMRVPCQHCAKAMAEITPRMVLDNLMEILNG